LYAAKSFRQEAVEQANALFCLVASPCCMLHRARHHRPPPVSVGMQARNGRAGR
jgi:hypothetical protein